MKRRLKIAALCFGLFVLLVISLLAWVIYTEAGLRFAVDRLPEKMGKVTLRIEDVRGTIAGGFSARESRRGARAQRTCTSRAAARASISGRCSSGASRYAAPRSDLVQIEVKRRSRSDRPTRRPSSCRACSASAPNAPRRGAWSSSRPMAQRVEFDDVTAPASSGTRPSASSTATSSMACCARAPSASCTPPIRRELSGETTTRMIIEGQPEWLAETSFDGDLAKLPLYRQTADAVPRRPERRAAGDVHAISTGAARPRCTTSTCAPSAPVTRSAS